MAKPPRKPNGSPELRSLDDQLKEVGDEAVARRLPGFGKPIDLGAYFSSGAKFRAAHKLLADNAVLPRPLQFLKEAESAKRRNLPETAPKRSWRIGGSGFSSSFRNSGFFFQGLPPQAMIRTLFCRRRDGQTGRIRFLPTQTSPSRTGIPLNSPACWPTGSIATPALENTFSTNTRPNWKAHGRT